MKQTAPISSLKSNPGNPRTITKKQLERLRDSLADFPQMLEARPIVVSPDMVVLGGNMRLEAARALGLKEVPIYVASWDERQAREFVIKDNLAFGDWDWDVLANEWEASDLVDWGLDVWQEHKETGTWEEMEPVSLADRFLVGPFSVLNARLGPWQERKRWWKEQIGDSGESRTSALSTSTSKASPVLSTGGVSVLDPVLAEVVVKWFGLEGGAVCDPCAGDTVFGYVAASSGMSFTGIELRSEQARLNNERCKHLDARWICDTGENVCEHLEAGSQDLVFSCPPYFDLETYSDDPSDLSNQTWPEYLQMMDTILGGCAEVLKDNRFAVVVIGDVRDEAGLYRRLPDTLAAIAHEHGLHLYNELVYMEPIGNLRLRVGKWMESRKVGKLHQYVLVMYKGDPEQIRHTFPKLEIPDTDEE